MHLSTGLPRPFMPGEGQPCAKASHSHAIITLGGARRREDSFRLLVAWGGQLPLCPLSPAVLCLSGLCCRVHAHHQRPLPGHM